MNRNDPRLELIRRCRDGEASPEELTHLNSLLREDADFRETYVRYMNLDVALGAVAKASPIPAPAEVVSRPRHNVWLQWRPLTAAAAGVVLGLFGASMVRAITSPRIVATVLRLDSLIDGSFETRNGRLAAGFPRAAGVWSGDETEVVNAEGTASFDGRRVLRFLRAGGEATTPHQPAEACDVYQIVDLRPLRGRLEAAGDGFLELSAEFLDTRTTTGAPLVFACHIYLFEGSAESLHTVWPPTARDTLGVGASLIHSNGGSEAGKWCHVAARCVVTPQADFAVLKLSAARGDRHGGAMPELGQQFADDVKLILKTQPVLPVRIVQH